MPWFHLTKPELVDGILRDGLLINQPHHLTDWGSWATNYYQCSDEEDCNPIYLANQPWSEIVNLSEELTGLAILKVDLPTSVETDLVADLPSLVDAGAYHNEGYLYWKYDHQIPPLLAPYHDVEWGIDIEWLVTPGEVAQAAVGSTQTAACLENIPPTHISFVGLV